MTNKVIKSITPKAGGGVILAFDFSSLEVMVFTNLAHETELGKIVQAGLDMHSAVAQKIFPELKDVPLKEIKSNYKKLRQYAKSATFGTLYGSSAFNLSQQLDIPTEQAQNIIDSLMKEFPGLQQYCDDCHSFAKTHGYIDTPFGYRRQLDQILLKFKDIETAKAMDKSNKYSKTNPHETNYGLRYKHALNASQNHVVQSTASICGWICASHIQEELIKQGLYSRLIGNVHDSCEIDVYPGELQDIMRIIDYHARQIPNKIYDWMDLVQLRFDYELGESWSGTAGECKVDFNEDGTTTVHWEGGNLWWDYLYKQLQIAYDIEILDKQEVRDYEKDEGCPLNQPDKEIKVDFKINNKTTIKEFKSKYYVGNGIDDTRIDVPDVN